MPPRDEMLVPVSRRVSHVCFIPWRQIGLSLQVSLATMLSLLGNNLSLPSYVLPSILGLPLAPNIPATFPGSHASSRAAHASLRILTQAIRSSLTLCSRPFMIFLGHPRDSILLAVSRLTSCFPHIGRTGLS